MSNTASSSTTKQNLFDCASFSVGADPDSAGDPCLASTTQVLTVHVPDCAFQVDLIYGEPLVTMTIGEYRDRASLDRWSGRQPLDRLHAANTDSDPDSHRRRSRRRPRRPRRPVVSRASPLRAPDVAVRWFRSRVSRSSFSASARSCGARVAGVRLQPRSSVLCDGLVGRISLSRSAAA